MRLKTIFPILLLLTGSVAILPAATVAPEKEPARPLQPFPVELLDQERGSWNFLNPLGQQLAHPGEVAVVAAIAPEKAKAAILRLDNPEFPGDAKRAEFREFPAAKPGFFQLRTNGFQADLSLKPDGKGTLSNIRLGSAVDANRIPAALYVSDGSQMIPVRLEGKSGGLKLQSNRVGSVFVGNEPVNLHAVRLGGGTPVEAEYIITDYFRNREIGRGKVRLDGEDTVFSVPLEKFGSFTVELKLPERSATLRVTHIPEPQKLDPERSFVGMNIFQQQMWYYSYQLPLFARAGVRWVRPWLTWENTWKMQEPKKGVFDTSHLDAMRRELARHNQKYIYLFYTFSPVLGLATSDRTPLDDAQMKQWLDYVKRIVAHCGEIDDFEVWNEPDLLAQNKQFSAQFYQKLLMETAQTIRRERPRARIHSLSAAGSIPWLKTICENEKSAESSDVVTLHSYAPAAFFVEQETPRQKLLDLGGFLGKPQQFNEIGASAYDESPNYVAAFPMATERIQAETLPVNWAQSLHFGGPQGKAYWFCSLDPRDSSSPGGRSWDSSIGLLYLGLQPKTAFAALAGMASIFDGHECLGRMQLPNSPVCYAAFSDDRAVVWSNDRKGETSATALGCNPEEELTVFDLFGNRVGGDKAESVTLKLDDGPRFLLGSKRLGELARTARAKWMQDRAATADAERQVGEIPPLPMFKIGERRIFEFNAPADSEVTWQTSRDFPGTLQVERNGNVVKGEIVASSQEGTGSVDFSIRTANKNLPVVHRKLDVSVDRRDYITDGTFSQGDLSQYSLIPGVSLESNDGSSSANCMRIDAPFNGRLHHKSDPFPLLPGRPFHFQVALKGKLSPHSEISFSLAMFVKGKWVGTWMPAALRDNAVEGGKLRAFTAKIPEHLDRWTTVSAVLPGNLLPKEETTVVFYIDSRGGEPGDFVLIDDLRLYQKESEDNLLATPWNQWNLERKKGLLIQSGTLLLESPLSARLHTPVELPLRQFRFSIRPRLDGETQLKIALACFNGKAWLGDRILAATQGSAVVRIPRQSEQQIELKGKIPALPKECTSCLLFVDGGGGTEGSRCELSPIELFQ